MIDRLPSWVWLGGFLLASAAGYINAVGVMGFYHQGVTHVTGQATLISVMSAERDFSQAFKIGAMLLSFLLGAVLSGMIIRDTTLSLGRRYGLVLMVESVLLGAASVVLDRGMAWGDLLLATAAGLQNGMVTTFSGAIVRTTHLTGVVTDIGVLLGHALRGQKLEGRKLSLLLAIVAGFMLGSFGGALGYQGYAYRCLWVPALPLGLAGVGYLAWHHWPRKA